MRSDRPVVALCMCRRSRSFPWCDTSHRAPAPVDAPSEQDSGRGDAQ
ncbi:CDGSH iron-sulfur domain-containing protein [Streptomyces sp. XH2]